MVKTTFEKNPIRPRRHSAYQPIDTDSRQSLNSHNPWIYCTTTDWALPCGINLYKPQRLATHLIWSWYSILINRKLTVAAHSLLWFVLKCHCTQHHHHCHQSIYTRQRLEDPIIIHSGNCILCLFLVFTLGFCLTLVHNEDAISEWPAIVLSVFSQSSLLVILQPRTTPLSTICLCSETLWTGLSDHFYWHSLQVKQPAVRVSVAASDLCFIHSL